MSDNSRYNKFQHRSKIIPDYYQKQKKKKKNERMKERKKSETRHFLINKVKERLRIRTRELMSA